MHLRPRRAERGGEVARVRLRRGGRRGGESEARLRRLGEAGGETLRERERGRGGRSAPVPAAGERGGPEGLRRPHGEHGRRPAGGRRAVERLGEPLLHRPDDEAAHQARVAEAHFRFGGVDVDVDLARVAFDEQRDDRVPVSGQEIHVGRAHRAGEDLVAHGAAVDEHELGERVRPAVGRQADPPFEPHALARRLERERICGEVVAERLAQPLRAARLARAGQPASRRESRYRSRRRSGSPGWLSATRFTISATAWASLRSDFRNLSLAGVAANRSRASTRVPTAPAQGSTGLFAPSSTTSFKAVGAPSVRVRISSRETEAIDGSASPRKPKVAIAVRSPSGIFDVACRSTESARSASSMPRPSSLTRIRRRPPASIATSIVRAPASSAFSINSLAAAAGRSITSPAAMRSTSSGSRRQIGMGA